MILILGGNKNGHIATAISIKSFLFVPIDSDLKTSASKMNDTQKNLGLFAYLIFQLAVIIFRKLVFKSAFLSVESLYLKKLFMVACAMTARSFCIFPSPRTSLIGKFDCSRES